MTDRFTREYSPRLGVLTGAQLQAVLDQFELGRLQAAEPAQAGLFGQNIFLDSDRGRYVLRACPHGPDQFPREQFFANQLHERTDVPVPWPYWHEPRAEILPYGFALLPRMPGECLGLNNRLAAVPLAERLRLGQAHGQMLARMHALTWPFAGQVDFFAGTVLPRAADDSVEARLQEQVAKLATAPAKATAEDLAQIEATLAAARTALTMEYTPTYVHHDFREGNTTVTPTGDGGYRVTGVFDLMEGYFGRPEEDFARYVNVSAADCPGAVSAFIAGYRAQRELGPGWQARLRLFALQDALGFWLYGQEHGWYDSNARLAPRLRAVLEVPFE